MSQKAPLTSAEEEVFLLLHKTASKLEKTAEEGLRIAALSVAEYTMLRIVQNTPGVTAAEAKERLYATAPAVAQLVAKLESRGMLRRGTDKSDARRLPLYLTAKGAKHVKSAKHSISQLLSELKLPKSLLHSLADNLSLFSTSLSSYASR